MASSSGVARLLVLCLAAAGAAAAQAAIYKCTDASGNTTYQQKPCDVAAAQSNVGNEPRQQAKPAAKSGTDPAIPTTVTWVIRCSERSPAFAKRIEESYKRWFDANASAVQAFQRTPEYGKVVAEARRDAQLPTSPTVEFERECKNTEELLNQAPR
ncbi:MAG TPA: DUF4124 domain-containing protein [Casimicrobiaceae bacterium]|nr:DUF4124 domain-containing protein [Casimicrobiaceae bacterium]